MARTKQPPVRKDASTEPHTAVRSVEHTPGAVSKTGASAAALAPAETNDPGILQLAVAVGGIYASL